MGILSRVKGNYYDGSQENKSGNEERRRMMKEAGYLPCGHPASRARETKTGMVCSLCAHAADEEWKPK